MRATWPRKPFCFICTAKLQRLLRCVFLVLCSLFFFEGILVLLLNADKQAVQENRGQRAHWQAKQSEQQTRPISAHLSSPAEPCRLHEPNGSKRARWAVDRLSTRRRGVDRTQISASAR
jgi:hypothetical protein